MSARYCTGYLGHIGVPRDPAPIDFSAWFEVFLGGRWYTFDARRNQPHRYCAEPRPCGCCHLDHVWIRAACAIFGRDRTSA
jgi:hypothetical protein